MKFTIIALIFLVFIFFTLVIVNEAKIFRRDFVRERKPRPYGYQNQSFYEIALNLTSVDSTENLNNLGQNSIKSRIFYKDYIRKKPSRILRKINQASLHRNENYKCWEDLYDKCKRNDECCSNNCYKVLNEKYGVCKVDAECRPLWDSHCQYNAECCSNNCQRYFQGAKYGYCTRHNYKLVNEKCGRPSLPLNAVIINISNERQIFDSQEMVTIDCNFNHDQNVFPFYDNKLQCINGRWVGKEPRCGINLRAQAIRIELLSCSSINESLTSQKLDEKAVVPQNAISQPFNAYNYLRVLDGQHIIVKGSDCYRYKVVFEEKVQIWFLSIDIRVDSNDTIIAPKLMPFVSKYRSCDLRKCVKHLSETNNSVTFAYHFICDLISTDDHRKGQSDLMDSLTFDIKGKVNYEMFIETIHIGKIYTDNKAEPKCGEIQMNSRVVSVWRDNDLYYANCKNSFVDINKVTKIGTAQNGNPIHKLSCNSNAQWIGVWPTCLPKTTCPTDTLFAEKDNSVIIEEFGNVYYFNESQWFAITDSFVRYSCFDENHELIGPTLRYCTENGTWSSDQPFCRPSYSKWLMILSIVLKLFGVFLIFASIVPIVCWIRSKQLKKLMEESENQIQGINDKLFSEDINPNNSHINPENGFEPSQSESEIKIYLEVSVKDEQPKKGYQRIYPVL